MSLKNIFKKKDKQDRKEINNNIPEALKEKVAEIYGEENNRRIDLLGIYQGEEVYDSCYNGPGPYDEGMPILIFFKNGVARIEDGTLLCFEALDALIPEE